jgi:hypothetical protein
VLCFSADAGTRKLVLFDLLDDEVVFVVRLKVTARADDQLWSTILIWYGVSSSTMGCHALYGALLAFYFLSSSGCVVSLQLHYCDLHYDRR